MIVNVDAKKLKEFLETSEDAEEVGAGEYAVDLYETEPALSMNIEFGKDGVDVLAALYLLYDEEQDGWYLGDKTKDTDVIEKALKQAIGQE